MKVTFLGTGTSQGIPVIGCDCEVCNSIDFHDKRLRTSILIEWEDLHLVIDTGPDFRQQMLRERVQKLDAVLFTHEHKDHTAGMDDIRSFNFKQKRDMPIYGRKNVLDQLQQEFAYVFAAKKYPGVPRVTLNTIDNNAFEITDKTIIPIEVLHYKLPVFGFRFQDFTYITDAKTIPDKEKQKIIGSKVLVLNALQQTEHISHLTLEEALELVEEIQPEKAYFTHLSHRMGTHRDVSSKLPSTVELAWDGLQITL
ncbi:MAG: MBL fold metallo-hydrolase [Bacteroidota bacterium]